ncbi:hypothetical protein BDZ89DRAFT_1057104 [Hymenopellis radicata]|nr:hypothetical protein BDZ89DRAFT_1057104 [Hymenopellis radicata]
MPHCDMELHEDILRANWTPSSLRNLILVCNRLGDYVDRCVGLPVQHGNSVFSVACSNWYASSYQ